MKDCFGNDSVSVGQADVGVRRPRPTRLRERLKEPRVPKDRLLGYENVYKIKLRSVGYRLAYEVRDSEIVVLVLKIGRRDKIYEALKRS